MHRLFSQKKKAQKKKRKEKEGEKKKKAGKKIQCEAFSAYVEKKVAEIDAAVEAVQAASRQKYCEF